MRMPVSLRVKSGSLAITLAAAASVVSSQSSVQSTAHAEKHWVLVELDRVRCKLARVEFLREIKTKALMWQLRRALAGPEAGTGFVNYQC